MLNEKKTRREDLAKILTDKILNELKSSAQGSVMLGLLPPLFKYDFSLNHVFSRFNKFSKLWDEYCFSKITIDGDSFLGDYLEKSMMEYVDKAKSCLNPSIKIDDSKTKTHMDRDGDELLLVVKLYSYEGKEYEKVFTFGGIVDPNVDTISIALPDYNEEFQKKRCDREFNSNFVDMLTKDILDEVIDNIAEKVENKNKVSVIVSSFNMLYIIKKLNAAKKKDKKEVDKTKDKNPYSVFHYVYNEECGHHVYAHKYCFGKTLDDVIDYLKKVVEGYEGGLYGFPGANYDDKNYIILNKSYKDDIYLITTSECIDNNEWHLMILKGYMLYPIRQINIPSVYKIYKSNVPKIGQKSYLSYENILFYRFTDDISKSIEEYMDRTLNETDDERLVRNIQKYGYKKYKEGDFFIMDIYDDVCEDKFIYHYE